MYGRGEDGAKLQLTLLKLLKKIAITLILMESIKGTKIHLEHKRKK